MSLSYTQTIPPPSRYREYVVFNSHLKVTRYASLFMICVGFFFAFNAVKAWIGSTVTFANTEREVTYASMNVV